MRKNKKRLAVEWLDEHFGEIDLDDLVVFRHIFPLWMRVDVQAAMLEFFSRIPDHKFFGCRITDTEGEFRFPNLIEDGEGAIAIGPPVYSMLDLGDGEPVQTQLRGLWLAEKNDLRYGVLCETTLEHWNTEFRVEVAVPPDDQGREFALAFLESLKSAGKRAEAFKGRILIPGSSVPEGMLVKGSLDFKRLPLTAISKEDIILDHRTSELFESNTIGFIDQVGALSKLEAFVLSSYAVHVQYLDEAVTEPADPVGKDLPSRKQLHQGGRNDVIFAVLQEDEATFEKNMRCDYINWLEDEMDKQPTYHDWDGFTHN